MSKVCARETGAGDLASKLAVERRRRMAWGVSLCAGLSLALGTGAFWYYRSPSQPSAAGGVSGPTGTGDSSTLVLPVAAPRTTMRQLQEEAIGVAEQLRAAYPAAPEALHVVAMLQAGLRQRGEAEQLWRRCIELAPSEAMYYINAAGAALDQGKGETAVETLQQALAAGCEPAAVYPQLAAVFNQMGRLDEARDALLEVLRHLPDSAEDWYLLGQTQSKLGQFAEAEASVKKALALAPAPPSALHVLANVCAAQGKREEAARYREQYREMTARAPRERSRQESTEHMAESYLGESRRIALLTLDEAATVYTRKGNLAEAEKLRLRSLALDPANADMLRELVVLYVDQQRFADAGVVLQRLVELEPDNAVEHLNLANVAAEAGDAVTAEAAFKRVIDLRPDASLAYYGLAQLYLKMGRLEQARLAAEEASRWAPSAESLQLLSDICRAAGDLPAAQAALARADKLARSGRPSDSMIPRQETR